MKQLTSDSKKTLSANIRKRIDAANSYISEIENKIKEQGGPTEEQKKDTNYLIARVADLQISYRLIFNTNWLIDTRKEYVEAFKDQIRSATEKGDLVIKQKAETYLAQLEKACKCQKCKHGDEVPGYNGFNVNTGEFVLCTCTRNTMHIIK